MILIILKSYILYQNLFSRCKIHSFFINTRLRGFTIRAHTVNPIDNLTYLYDDFNKNLLRRVFDASANQDGFKDDTDGTNINNDINDVPDYEYDANGNMTKDDNKGITKIKYNHLNLPVEIVFQTEQLLIFTML